MENQNKNLQPHTTTNNSFGVGLHKVAIKEESDQYAWVSSEESKKYNLIDGIYDEFVMIDKLMTGEKVLWQRFTR